ncbi:TonB-dependent receptor [Pelomonas sp. KK5]|uniref:TonB-dependent receptor n=1 Tax=Pelomonas sp. KK5 TaxID=1855730 RepID=UPI001301B262|nr:TonB-dependent receptor [Pelomonas sp. KK5]
MKRITRLSAIAAATALLWSTAQAQEAPPPPAPADDAQPAAGKSALEAVVITAQGRRELLQNVPVVVKAFSAKQIEDAGIKSTQDFVNMTPNMSFDNSFTYGNSFVVIRGVSQINNADSPVAVVVDGVPQSDQKQLKMNLVDVARIEVLKGPQGSLYGRNAIGGAIVIDTKSPGNALEGFAKVDYSSGSTRELSGGVSGALVPDTLMFRLVGQTKGSDGQIENSYLKKNVDAVGHDNLLRGRLTWMASDTVQLDLRASTNTFRAGATWDALIPDGDLNKRRSPSSNVLGKTEGYADELTFKADVETGLGTLTAITNRAKLREKFVGDGDFGNPVDNGITGAAQRVQGKDRRTTLTSQELRLTSPGNQPLRWIAGLFYLTKTMDFEEKSFADVNGDTAQYDTAPVLRYNVFKNKASAAFGQVEYDLTPATKIAAGLRYDRDDRERIDTLNAGTRVDASFDSWQPKLTMTHKLGADALGFATYSTGFRSGGFNTTAADQPIFKAENLRNIELGYKASFLDQRLMLNVAAFHSDSRDFQYFYIKLLANNSLSGRIANIDRVTIKGLDLDLRYAPLAGLEFDAGFGLTDSRITANAAEPSTVGNHTPKSSPWKATFGAQYTTALGDGLNGFARMDVEVRSRKYWHPDNILVSDGMTLLGARLGLRGPRDRWSVNLYGKNLTNKFYYADVNGKTYNGWAAPIVAIGSQAAPRTVGIELNYKL